MGGSLSKYKADLAARGRTINELRKGSVPQALGGAAVVDGAAFAAGFADTYIGAIGGVQPSVAAGVAAAVAGVTLKSPKAIRAASGLLAHAAYKAGTQAAESVGKKTTTP